MAGGCVRWLLLLSEWYQEGKEKKEGRKKGGGGSCEVVPSSLSVDGKMSQFSSSSDSNVTECIWPGCYLASLLPILLAAPDVNGRWWKLQAGSKEQQTNHSQRFLLYFFFFFFFFLFFLDGACERSLLFPLAFSRAVS